MNMPIDSDLKKKGKRENDETEPSAANQYNESLEVEDLVKTSNDNQKKKKKKDVYYKKTEHRNPR